MAQSKSTAQTDGENQAAKDDEAADQDQAAPAPEKSAPARRGQSLTPAEAEKLGLDPTPYGKA